LLALPLRKCRFRSRSFSRGELAQLRGPRFGGFLLERRLRRANLREPRLATTKLLGQVFFALAHPVALVLHRIHFVRTKQQRLDLTDQFQDEMRQTSFRQPIERRWRQQEGLRRDSTIDIPSSPPHQIRPPRCRRSLLRNAPR
jgi:hypothetical protein